MRAREDSLGRGKTKNKMKKWKRKATDFLRVSQMISPKWIAEWEWNLWRSFVPGGGVEGRGSCQGTTRPGSQQGKGAFKVINQSRLGLKERSEKEEAPGKAAQTTQMSLILPHGHFPARRSESTPAVGLEEHFNNPCLRTKIFIFICWFSFSRSEWGILSFFSLGPLLCLNRQVPGWPSFSYTCSGISCKAGSASFGCEAWPWLSWTIPWNFLLRSIWGQWEVLRRVYDMETRGQGKTGCVLEGPARGWHNTWM